MVARPKSVILSGAPSSSDAYRMFAGLMSRWRMLCRWSACSPAMAGDTVSLRATHAMVRMVPNTMQAPWVIVESHLGGGG